VGWFASPSAYKSRGKTRLMLIISAVLGLIPLLGVVWVLVSGTLTTVDGLFTSLILLTLSGILFLNVFLELRERGLLKKKSEPPKTTKAS
jgi:Na+-driven multidrug efflux pump